MWMLRRQICNLLLHVLIYIINMNHDLQYSVGKEFRSSLCQRGAYGSVSFVGLETKYWSRFLFPSLSLQWWMHIENLLPWQARGAGFSFPLYVNFFTVLAEHYHNRKSGFIQRQIYRAISQAEMRSFWWPCKSHNIGCANSVVRKASLSSTYVWGDEKSASPLKGRAVKEFTDLF